MLPPKVSSRKILLQEEKKRAADARRRIEEERQREAKATQDFFASPSLFEKPKKINSEDSTQVAQVLGNFNNAQRIINSRNSCIGIDYQPPTPAPIQHVIGEDDDHATPVSTPATSMYGSHNAAHLAQHHKQLTQQHLQRQQQQQRLSLQPHPGHPRASDNHPTYPKGPNSLSMPPPSSMHGQVNHSSAGAMMAPQALPASTSQRLKQVSQSLPKLDLLERQHSIDDDKLNDMLREMKNPLLQQTSEFKDDAMMPPPLTAIITPRVTNHEGNNSRIVPKYFAAPTTSPPSPVKPLPPSPNINIVDNTDAGQLRPFGQAPLATSTDQDLFRGKTPLLSGISNPRLSEDSESDHEKTVSSEISSKKAALNDVLEQQQQKIQQQQPLKTQQSTVATVHNSTTDSSSDDSSTDDSSSDEDNKHHVRSKHKSREANNANKVAAATENATGGDNDVDNNFSLGSLLCKVKKQSPGPSTTPASNSMQQPSPRTQLGSTPQLAFKDNFLDVDDDDDELSDMLSHNRPSLEVSTLIDDHTDRSLLGISQPLSPIQQSPPHSDRRSTSSKSSQSKHARRRNSHVSNSIIESSDEEDASSSAASRIRPKKPKKAEGSGKKKARKPTPRMTALAQQSQSQEEEEDESDLVDKSLMDLHPLPTSTSRKTNNRSKVRPSGPSSRKSPSRAAAVAAMQKPAAPSPVYVSSSSPAVSDDESKDVSYGVKKAKSPTKRRTVGGGKKVEKATTPSSKAEEEEEEEEEDESPPLKSATKKAAISRIFPVKSASSKGNKTGKSGIKVEVSHAKAKASPRAKLTNAVAYRPDGRPTILCRIPFESLSSRSLAPLSYLMPPDKEAKENKRERRNSTTSSASASSRRSHKRRQPSAAGEPPKPKRSRSNEPEPASTNATDLETLPGYDQNRGFDGSLAGPSSSSRALMPPPTKMFYSYLEQRQLRNEQDDDLGGEDDFNLYMLQAKKLKHEADGEQDRPRQAMKYLEAVLYFILCGHNNEVRGDKMTAFTMYKETLNLVRHVCRPFRNSEFGNFDNKLAVLSLRCQSLLYLKLYKLKKHELKECQKILGVHLQNASTKSQQNSPAGGANATSPTPSPAGSEGSVCSKSSGYTSAGELPPAPNPRYNNPGVLTPPTHNGGIGGNGANIGQLTVPQNIMQKQHQFCSFLSQCHELWEMADVYTHRGHCLDFIIRLDQTCGPLTLHSTLKDLVKYTQAGLDYLSKEKESPPSASSASSS